MPVLYFMPTARQIFRKITLADLDGKPMCNEHPKASGCGDNGIRFKIKVRLYKHCTWWVTCNFDTETKDTDCKKEHKYNSLLCYDLVCATSK